MWSFLVEAVLVLIAVAVVQATPRLARHRWLAVANQRLRSIAANKNAAVWIIFALSLLARLAILPIVPLPEPQNHDEFSYLLAADTFASGRLTNATHPLWHHFETFHVEHEPTYMSMYPAGPGLLLAAAQTSIGVPWVGVLLATAGMCAAITWMLQAWLPPYWAFIGGLLAVMRIGLFSYWVNSYWGGALAALAGALFLGALTRLCMRPSALHATLVALSVVVLANTRMYEGALLVAATIVSMTVYGRLQPLRLCVRTVAPITVIVIGAAAAMLYYNYRVYGSALTLPYSINRNTYATAQIFVWQEPKPVPTYRHVALQDFYVGLELDRFRSFRTPYGFVTRSALKLVVSYLFFLGPLFTVPLFWVRLRDNRTKVLTAISLLMIPGILVSAWFAPHYVSPATCLAYALLLQGMRRLSVCRNAGSRVGTAAISMLVVIATLMTIILTAAAWMHIPFNAPPLSWCGWTNRQSERDALVKRLTPQQARHLVIVRYAAHHRPVNEFVFNKADIDHADIVWAREMPTQSNQALLEYFRGRRAWLFEPDLTPPQLTRLQ